MIRDDIRRISLPSRSSVAERRPYKPVVAGSIPAGRILPSRLPCLQTVSCARASRAGA